MDKIKGRRLLSVWLVLAALFSAAVSFLMLSQAREGNLSTARLMLALIPAAAALFLMILIAMLFISPAWAKRMVRLPESLEHRPTRRTALALFAGLGGLFFAYLAMLAPEVGEPYAAAYFTRLAPLFLWLAGLCLLLLGLVVVVRWLPFRTALHDPAVRLGFGFYFVFILLWLWMARTRIGLTPETIGWNDLGMQILETQALLAWLSGVALLLAGYALERPLHKPANLPVDALLSLVIFAAAAIIWLATPAPPNWFRTEPRPPNEAYYPNSDALIYDSTGQNLLVGEGLRSKNEPFTRRPAYAGFLALLNAIGGESYERVVAMHVLVLALFPVMIFWIARLLHSRTAGLIAAALIILRESNAISLANTTTISNSKTLMADLPTALGVSLFALLVLVWLLNPPRRMLWVFWAGVALGAFILVRPEAGIVIGAAGLVALLALRKDWPRWLTGMALAGAGAILIITPWVTRNYLKFGQIFLDSPIFRAELVVQRYNENPAQVNNAIQAGETGQEYVERVAETTGDFVRQNPDQVARFIASNFMNSQTQFVLMFPGTLRVDTWVSYLGHSDETRLWAECCSGLSYIRRLPFRQNWTGNLLQQSILPIATNLALLAVGIAVAWRRRRWAGLLPLVIALLYTLMHAAFRNSGGRYILPVDWASILYYGIGLAQVTFWAAEGLSGRKVPPLAAEGMPKPAAQVSMAYKKPGWGTLAASAALVLLLGSSLPLAERLVAKRYTPERQQAMWEAVLASERLNETARRQLRAVVENGGVAQAGRGLYPRYFEDGEGEVDKYRGLFPRQYGYAGLYLIGPYNTGVTLAVPESPPVLPNAADMLVIGCPMGDYYEALVLAVFLPGREEPYVYPRQGEWGTTCPLPEPVEGS